MSNFNITNELKFTLRDRSLWLWMFVVFSLSCLAVGFGLAEVKQQNTTIQTLIEANKEDRIAESKKLKDWGSAAYYSFHFTHEPPSDFAFAALGQRDNQSWKHRVRMLAFEGQIYERDAGNPSVALIGRFDFSFLAAFIFPLVLIMLLYDLRSSEITAGRFNLLASTSSCPRCLWVSRALLRTSAVVLCLIIPMIFAGLIAGTSFGKLFWASFCVCLFAIFWALVCYKLSTWNKPGSVILMALVGIWLTTAVIIPAGSRLIVDRAVPLPSGADILLLQRETVNDAWDLPREATLKPFFEQHPEWSDYQKAEGGFEWAWYYAFQQVGDQVSASLVKKYREGRLRREKIAAWVSFLAPSSRLERSLQSLANTDIKASIDYEDKVRAYHAELRAYYYPKFFRNESFDKSLLKNLPSFNPDN